MREASVQLYNYWPVFTIFYCHLVIYFTSLHAAPHPTAIKAQKLLSQAYDLLQHLYSNFKFKYARMVHKIINFD
jgi:hypothetical protein